MRWPKLLVLIFALMMFPAFAADRPNIILMMSDDMGYSDIGCYGGEIRTPNLDRLAAGGLRFTQFYNTGRCCPTRASLLTGLYPHQAGIGHMMEDRNLPGYTGDLSNRARTIAQVLKQAGYATFMSGKWHVTKHQINASRENRYNWPRQRGFDRFYGTIIGAGSFYDPASLVRDNEYITPENDPLYQPQTYYYTDAISDNAVLFMQDHFKQSRDQPFFMYVSYTAAHWPMHALPRDIAKYEGVYDKGYEAIRRARLDKARELGVISPNWATTRRDARQDIEQDDPHWDWEVRNMQVYAAMVDNMDQGVGRIVETLKDNDALNNTLILFLQDNGGCAETIARGEPNQPYRTDYKPLGKDGLQTQIWPPMQTRDGQPVRQGKSIMPGPDGTYHSYGRSWANVSNTPFRLYKHFVHEGGIATPLIAHWPDGFDAKGKLRSQPSHLIDIMATCVEIAGAKYPKAVDGENILPMQGVSLVSAFADKPLQREAIYWEHEGNRAIRIGDWKLVARGAKGKWELYNMASDRTETRDLAADHPDRVEKLASQWEKWAAEALVKPWPWD